MCKDMSNSTKESWLLKENEDRAILRYSGHVHIVLAQQQVNKNKIETTHRWCYQSVLKMVKNYLSSGTRTTSKHLSDSTWATNEHKKLSQESGEGRVMEGTWHSYIIPLGSSSQPWFKSGAIAHAASKHPGEESFSMGCGKEQLRDLSQHLSISLAGKAVWSAEE